MSILAIDTCLGACSVAVSRLQSHDIVSRMKVMDTGQAEALMPMIADVMAGAVLPFDALKSIAVTVGPGTFTGTRIGVAAARGLALALDLPVHPANSLAVVAATAAMAFPGSDADEILVVVDARRGEVYAALYDASGEVERVPPAVLTYAAAGLLPGTSKVLVAGTGTAAVMEAGLARSRVAGTLPDLQPEAAALIGLTRTVHSGPGSAAPAAGPVRPLYLRPPDARPQAQSHQIAMPPETPRETPRETPPETPRLTPREDRNV